MTAAVQEMKSPGLSLSPRAKLEILFATLLALFLFALDQTVVGTALPMIVTDLNGNELYTWAFTIYLLTSTISGPLYGKLSDLFGRRPISCSGSACSWSLRSCGLSARRCGSSSLARGLQGLGAGAVFPVALAVMADLYTPAERGQIRGFFGAVFGLSSILGPAIGGLITDTFGWHWIFFLNVPIGLDLVLRLLPAPAAIKPDADGAHRLRRRGTVHGGHRPDPGRADATSRRGRRGPTRRSAGLIAARAACSAAVFSVWEPRVPEPIVPLDLFRNRTFTISVTAMFLAAFGFFGAVVFLPRWFQVVAGSIGNRVGLQDPAVAGALIVSATVSGQIVAGPGATSC